MGPQQPAKGTTQKKSPFAFFKPGHKARREPSKERSISDPHSIHSKTNALFPLEDIGLCLPDSILEAEFSSLDNLIESHVRKFYQDGQRKEISQFAVEHATTGLSISWLTVLSLLGQEDTRMRAICLCISWTLLSRSLLLKLGLSSSPGSTFLPPEIVECFQSFSSVLSGALSGGTESQEGHFALLSRWKQISATLMHSTYVRDAFSLFDPRTVNIERAINDLDPLLRAYASSDPRVSEARLTDLRDILRQGAKFAFLLFSQPCFWQFDWKEESGKGKGKGIETMTMGAENPVVWPSLLRVMDGEGRRLEVPEVIGRKRFLKDFQK